MLLQNLLVCIKRFLRELHWSKLQRELQKKKDIAVQRLMLLNMQNSSLEIHMYGEVQALQMEQTVRDLQ